LAPLLAEGLSEDVLLVDANFRRPRLADYFDLEAERTLVDVLLGAIPWREAVCGTAHRRFAILPGGRFPSPDGRPPNWVELRSVVDELRGHFRLILLDAAALCFPEVGGMSRACDGTYLVVQLGATGSRAARQAAHAIGSCGGQLWGCVVVGG